MPKNLSDLSDFQKDLLKQEIEIIDKTIARIDQIQQSMKNWCITVWGGSLYLIVEHLGKSYLLVLLSAMIPVLFGYIDVVWKRQILKVSYRQAKISDFVSDGSIADDFRILDPIAKGYPYSAFRDDFKSQTSFYKALWYKADALFYLVMILVSLLLAAALRLKF